MHNLNITKNLYFSSMDTRVIFNIEDLYPYAFEWNKLNSSLPHNNPLMSYEWILSFIESKIENNETWAVVVCSHQSDLMAVLPLVITDTKKYGVSFQQLELPYDNQTMSVDMLMKPRVEKDIFKSLIKFVFINFPKSKLIVFRRIDENTNLLNNYQSYFLSHTEFCESGAQIIVPKNYHEFRNNLSKNFKSNLNKSNNKAIKSGGMLFLDDDLISLPSSEKLKIVCEMENSGWKGNAGSSIISSNKDLLFYENLVDRLEKSGVLYFHFLKIGEDIVAGNIGIKHGEKLLLWKLAYDDSFKKYSPGGLLLERLIERNSLNKNFTSIDFMTGESWYKNWNMSWRNFINIYIIRFSFIGLYIKLILILKHILKKFIN
jgi:hypothetical protein